MKKYVVSLILILCAFGADCFGQSHSYLFQNFEEANILFRNRSKSRVKLNFDMLDQKLYFLNGETLMELTNPYAIDTVFVSGRKFIFKSQKFCEVFKNPKGDICINWLIKNVNVGSKGAYGMPTQGKVEVIRNLEFDVPYTVTNWGELEKQGQYSYDMLKKKSQNTYFFSAAGKECKAVRLADLYKSFPDKADEIKAFAKANKLDMTTAEKAVKMIEFIYTLY